MIVLGLGSNVGNRLENLRRAHAAIATIPGMRIEKVSPIYQSNALLPEGAPEDWDTPYLNCAIRCHSDLKPHDLLQQLKTIEWAIGKKPDKRHWGPRIIDIDILVFDDLIIATDDLTVPHENLQTRPFALWPLADVAPFWRFPLTGKNHGKTAAEIVEQWGSRFDQSAPFQTHQLLQRLTGPKLVGVINVTPDSFSDGALYTHVDAVNACAQHLVASGAEIIDIGAESTCPVATVITPDIEWQRLSPILSSIKTLDFIVPPQISLDTRHALVAEKALELNCIDWINDVTGLDDARMRELVLAAKKDCVFMHHLSIPENRQHTLPRELVPTQLVFDWAVARLQELEKWGFDLDRLIFDPGIGFGKMAEQSFAILQSLDVFASLGVRILIGHSRKTFLSLVTNKPFAERDPETMALSVCMANAPVDYLRVHDVELSARGLRTAFALQA